MGKKKKKRLQICFVGNGYKHIKLNNFFKWTSQLKMSRG